MGVALAVRIAALEAKQDDPGTAMDAPPDAAAPEADEWGTVPGAARRFNVTKEVIRQRVHRHPDLGLKQGSSLRVNLTKMARAFWR